MLFLLKIATLFLGTSLFACDSNGFSKRGDLYKELPLASFKIAEKAGTISGVERINLQDTEVMVNAPFIELAQEKCRM